MPSCIWVDADACPKVVRDILFRAAQRTGIDLVLVANQTIATPANANIRSIQVPQGFDIADNEIVRLAQPGDLVITADIPLAAEVMEKGAEALNPRGERYTDNSIRQRLNMRDFMDTLRSSGVHTGGPPPLGQKEKQLFANHLDQYLSRWKSKNSADQP